MYRGGLDTEIAQSDERRVLRTRLNATVPAPALEEVLGPALLTAARPQEGDIKSTQVCPMPLPFPLLHLEQEDFSQGPAQLQGLADLGGAVEAGSRAHTQRQLLKLHRTPLHVSLQVFPALLEASSQQ